MAATTIDAASSTIGRRLDAMSRVKAVFPAATARHLILKARALPLPLRADGAARAAAEVQGLVAGRPLVPGQPADPDGCVRARLQGAAEGGERAGLPGLPHLGP